MYGSKTVSHIKIKNKLFHLRSIELKCDFVGWE